MSESIIITIIIGISIIILSLCILLSSIVRKLNNSENQEINKKEEYPYIKCNLLTKNEWAFYKQLKPIADKYNLHILSKVRLGDLVEVKKGISNSERLRAHNKINSKHVDFVIANPANLAILCLIELDDNSHNKIDRQQRDYFIERVCETADLPIIRCYGIDGFENELCKKLKINIVNRGEKQQ